MPHFRISEAATLLNVSDDTVRRWVESGRLKSATGQGPQGVDGASLAGLAVELAKERRDERGASVSASTIASSNEIFLATTSFN